MRHLAYPFRHPVTILLTQAGQQLSKMSHQIVNLMVPPAWDEDDLPSFLYDFKRRAALSILGVEVALLQLRGSDVKGQVAVPVPEELLLPRREDQPFLFPTDIG